MFAVSSHGPLQSGASLCRRCLRRQASTSMTVRIAQRSFSQRMMRKLKQGVYVERNKTAGKYLLKMQAANADWAAKAERIGRGEEQHIWDLLEERGYVKDVVGSKDTIREKLRLRRIGAYVGIDPTARSLHIGHLLPLMALFWMYMHGYTAVSLIGGATAKIGDPTGRLQSRQAMSSDDLTVNMAKIHYQLKRIWVNVDRQATRYGYEKDWAWRRALENNNMWWNSQSWLEVIKRVGTSMRIGPMLGRDTVKMKMTQGDGVSFAEFSYPIMQGWDWWILLNRLNVQMQIGGSDQFGNIISGIDVVKSARNSEPNKMAKLPSGELDDPIGFTVPLLTDKSGIKFGKSAGNAVWLDSARTSIFDFYGYFMRRPDDEVEKLLKLFTFLPLDKIEAAMAKHNTDPTKRVGQHLLASEVCALIHGEVNTIQAQKQHVEMYGKENDIIEYIASLRGKVPLDTSDPQNDEYKSDESHPVTLNNAPPVDMILPESLILGKSIPKILYAARLTESIAEGKRGAAKKGIYLGARPGSGMKKEMALGLLDFTPISAWSTKDTRDYLIDGRLLILRRGKHNVRMINMVSDEEYRASGQTYPGMHELREEESLKATRDKLQQQVEVKAASAETKTTKSTITFPRKEKPDNIVSLHKEIRELEEELATLDDQFRIAEEGNSKDN